MLYTEWTKGKCLHPLDSTIVLILSKKAGARKYYCDNPEEMCSQMARDQCQKCMSFRKRGISLGMCVMRKRDICLRKRGHVFEKEGPM